MNRDELNRRNTAAITHWWTTMRDSGRVEPGLLSDLAGIADEHARQHALSIEESHRGEHAPVKLIPVEPKTVLRTDRKPRADVSPLPDPLMQDLPGPTEAAPHPPVAADPEVTTGGNGKPDLNTAVGGGGAGATGTQHASASAAGGGASPSSRTRTRTRGGPPK